MSGSGGRWVEVAQPGGGVRRDWRPDDQPASPDGGPGAWHVVTVPGADARWEWVPCGAAAAAPPSAAWAAEAVALARAAKEPTRAAAAAANTAGRRVSRGRAAAAGGLALAVVALGLTAVQLLRAGDRRSDGPGPSAEGPRVATPSDAAPDASRSDDLPRGVPSAAELGRDVAAVVGNFQIIEGGSRGRSGGLPVIVINSGATVRHLDVTIEAVGATGPVATETVRVQDLPPGESRSRTLFGGLSPDRLDALAAAEFRIVGYRGVVPFRL